MHAVSSYRGNRPTNTHTSPHITIHCAARLSEQSKYEIDLGVAAEAAKYLSRVEPAINIFISIRIKPAIDNLVI